MHGVAHWYLHAEPGTALPWVEGSPRAFRLVWWFQLTGVRECHVCVTI